MAIDSTSKNAQAIDNRVPLKGVKKIILVASGKGGVGKSTTAVGITMALANKGYKVGIADADIYGPSIPTMLGVNEMPEHNNGRIKPIIAHGVKCSSIGFLVDAVKAAMWRGPMATKALHQIIRGVDWGELDYLIVDLPPGTGDIQISLVQNYFVDGAVIVSTPQDIALADAKRAVQMFNQVGINIIGLVENMAYYEDSTGTKNYIFGQGGAVKYAKAQDINVLGQIPLIQNVRESLDKGNADEIYQYYKDVVKGL